MKKAAAFLLLAAGCAKEPSPPPAAPSAPAAEPVASSSTPAEPAVDSAPASSAPDASAPSAPSAAEPAGEPKLTDECAPIAAAFESSLRPKLKKCWLDVANKKPNERIVGAVRYVIEIDSTGVVRTRKQAEPSDLPAPILQCMLKAVKAEPIDAKKCPMKTLTVAEKFPR